MTDLNKLRYLFPRDKKAKFLILSFFVFSGMLFELLSILSIYPFVTLILDDSIHSENHIFRFISVFIDENQAPFFYGILLIIIYVFKAIFFIYLTYRLQKFTQSIVSSIQNNIFANFLKMDFSDYLKLNSGELVRDFTTEIKNFSSYLDCMTIIISEILLLAVLSSFLIFLNPIPFLITFLFLILFSVTIYLIPKKIFQSLGENLRALEIELNQNLIESLNGYKEIFFNNKQEIFERKFKFQTSKRVGVISKYKTYNILPKNLIEAIAVIGFVVYSLISMKNSNADLIINLSFIVASTFKMLPSINRLILNFQNLKYNRTSLEIIYKKLTSEVSFKTKIQDKINEVSVKNLSFSYDETSVFKDLNFNIKKGDIFIIYGKSGSGKSTLLNLITGLLKAKKGHVFINGEESFIGLRGYVSQNSFLFNASVLFNITFENDIEKVNQKKLRKALVLSNTIDFIEEGSNDLFLVVEESGTNFSGGQKQRISFARALYNNSDFFLFDEPTSALDFDNEKNFIRSLRDLNKKGATIIVVTHSEFLKNSFEKKLNLEENL